MIITASDYLLNRKVNELDELLCDRAAIATIERFFNDNQDNLHFIILRLNPNQRNLLFTPEFVNAIDKRFLKPICKALLHCPGVWSNFEGKLVVPSPLILVPIVSSRWIAAEKRAVCWNTMQVYFYRFTCKPCETYAHDLFVYNECARRSYGYYGNDAIKRIFIQHTSNGKQYNRFNSPIEETIAVNGREITVEKVRGFNSDVKMLQAIYDDQVSSFEMQRQLQGRGITVSMLLFLLNNHAINCFLHLLVHYPKQVYRTRSAGEWLFTVCRHAQERFAVPFIKAIEVQNPGIIAHAHDPWGNTLLWNTLAKGKGKDKIQETLISLGCNPDEMNPLGLSFRLIKENDSILNDSWY